MDWCRYLALVKKDAQIYIERMKKQQQHMQQSSRSLFLWAITGLEVRAYADSALHGRDNCIAYMRLYNPEALVASISTDWGCNKPLVVQEFSRRGHAVLDSLGGECCKKGNHDDHGVDACRFIAFCRVGLRRGDDAVPRLPPSICSGKGCALLGNDRRGGESRR